MKFGFRITRRRSYRKVPLVPTVASRPHGRDATQSLLPRLSEQGSGRSPPLTERKFSHEAVESTSTASSPSRSVSSRSSRCVKASIKFHPIGRRVKAANNRCSSSPITLEDVSIQKQLYPASMVPGASNTWPRRNSLRARVRLQVACPFAMVSEPVRHHRVGLHAKENIDACANH